MKLPHDTKNKIYSTTHISLPSPNFASRKRNNNPNKKEGGGLVVAHVRLSLSNQA